MQNEENPFQRRVQGPREGETRIPSGCAICGIFSRSGKPINGDESIRSMIPMHDRSNGLGGGFAGYGIYPQYKDYYAFHVFYDDTTSKELCEEFLDRHYDIASASKIPVRPIPQIKDGPLIWRYFVIPQPTELNKSQLDEKEFVARTVLHINEGTGGLRFFKREKYGCVQRCWVSGGYRKVFSPGGV